MSPRWQRRASAHPERARRQAPNPAGATCPRPTRRSDERAPAATPPPRYHRARALPRGPPRARRLMPTAARDASRHRATITAAPVSSGAPATRSSICTRASPISRNRRVGSLSRHRRSSRRTPEGTAAGSAPPSGSVVSTDASVSEVVSPVKSRRPVSISNSTTPNAQMSARRSTGLPRACSGLIYAAVPRMMPASVIAGAVIVGDCESSDAPPAWSMALANPKSITFTVPSGRTLIFAGFKSRWMMACSCAASSASAIWRAMRSASSSSDRSLRGYPRDSPRLRPAP